MSLAPVTRRDMMAIVGVLAALWALSLAGMPEAFGAHPWWAVRVGMIGSTIGVAVYAGLRLLGRSRGFILILGGAGLIAAALSARIGKQVFATSLAENAVAGRFWFLGWFAVFAFIAILFLAVVQRGLRR